MLITACRVQKAALSKIPLKETQAQQLVTDIENRALTYQTLNATSKISYKDAYGVRSAMARIRMERDSAIWFSLSFIGIPVARALITRDSLLFYDKISHSYLKEDLKSISDSLGLDLSLDKLQDLLSGRPITVANTALYKLDRKADQYLLQYDAKTDPTTAFKGLASLISVSANDRISAQSLYKAPGGLGIRISYNDHMPIGQQYFPKAIHIQTLGTRKPHSVQIEYRAIQVDKPIRMPFHIPDGYKRSSLSCCQK